VAVKVAENRRGFQALLDDACARLRFLKNGRPHYQALSLAIGLSRSTLLNNLRRGDTLPAWPTLFALRDKADIPMAELLFALDVITLDDVKALTGLQRTLLDLNESERVAAAHFKTWPAQTTRDYLHWLEQEPPQGGRREAV
jgi:hypothetical protein